MPSQLDIGRLSTVAVFTLLLYDYTLTTGREIELFWKRSRTSWTFSLFIANRYITLFGHVLPLVYSFWPYSDFSRCVPLRQFIRMEIFVVQIIGTVIMTMRVYALCRSSWRVLIFLGTLILAAGAVGCWSLFSPKFNSSTSTIPLRGATANVGCPSSAFYFPSEQALYIAIAWIGQLTFDIFVFLLTLLQTLRIRKTGRRSITDVFLRDGCLYFAVMCCGVISNMTVLLKATNSTKGLSGSVTNAISATLISRLMLNLRDPRITDTIGSSLHPLTHTQMVFTYGETTIDGVGKASMPVP
ncbi:hypothetical protein SCLCIDRAFT_1219631 [Scleroderma citrinum Foug A]|uniref:DUF6533 domain-containing protein n=1 Tax=Scleroderma citrinum Foug A TaxID=1036808 RepID=A0A0C2Z5H3_9AGAM|nr:hypothetical protein SCLCIDRAFT_1219631 [Scleroderma citrinum Foug A]